MTSVYVAWRYVGGIVPSEDVFRLYGVVMGILVVSWLVMEPRIPATQKPSFDHGMMIWLTFPLFALYQMYTSHRWRGIFIVLGLAVLLAAPNISLALAHAFG
jgi:hypothetical protein